MASIYLINALYQDKTSQTAARSMQPPNESHSDLLSPNTTTEPSASTIASAQPVTEPDQPVKEVPAQRGEQVTQNTVNMHPSRQEMVDFLGLFLPLAPCLSD